MLYLPELNQTSNGVRLPYIGKRCLVFIFQSRKSTKSYLLPCWWWIISNPRTSFKQMKRLYNRCFPGKCLNYLHSLNLPVLNLTAKKPHARQMVANQYYSPYSQLVKRNFQISSFFSRTVDCRTEHQKDAFPITTILTTLKA